MVKFGNCFVGTGYACKLVLVDPVPLCRQCASIFVSYIVFVLHCLVESKPDSVLLGEIGDKCTH